MQKHLCKGKNEEDCLKDKSCIFTKGKKRQFCRSAKNKTLKKSKMNHNITLKQKSTKQKSTKQMPDKKKNSNITKSLNLSLANVLEEISTGENALGRVFQARAYKNAAEEILVMPPFTDIQFIHKKKRIGPKIFQKLKLFTETGTFPLLERIRNDPQLKLTAIYGIGHKKANELVEKHNILSIDDLKKNQSLLNNKQKIGLQYYEDILERIPREEIIKHEHIIRKELSDGLNMEIVGSYRRGAKNSGDIDVIFTHDDFKTGLLKFQQTIKKLEDIGYITHILAKGKKKSMFLAKIKDGQYQRRIDFLFTPKEEYPFAILYFTGSKYFNIYMRRHALKRGISLNEQGMKNIKTKEKINISSLITERDIFQYFDLQYIKPEDRKGRDSIILLK